ncbi:MAG: hypothetical protein AAFN93_26705, partial [Bacteroidota bacterium]
RLIAFSITRYKGFSAEDVVFDYAICIDCAMNIRNSFSAESKKKIDEYFLMHAGKLQKNFNENQELGSCMITGKAKSDLEEYQIYAHCVGNHLSNEVPPYLISGIAQDELMQLISNETLDILNGFFDRHFSPDPELLNPVPKPVLI